ncbi:MAG: ThuA domain-containing protein [Gemmatimonadota bacterium]|nr:ThuA domain-containing protein [Gemmatimonadota bacterium]
MKFGLKLLVGLSLTVVSLALPAQEPGAPAGPPPGAPGAGARGRGGFGGGGFVPNPTFDKDAPVLPADLKSGGVLIFSKTNGFREEAGVQASDAALAAIAHERGYPYFVTENGAVMNKEQLSKFKLVIWNNNSGDVLTPEQREVFKTWVENGGSYMGTHGAGGDPKYATPNGRSSLADWPWYIETLLGAQFTSHSSQQFGDAHVEDAKSPLTKGMPHVFNRRDEFYSFATNPRSLAGFHILITADEKSYKPGGATMGDDHPLAWWHCVGKGHVFYSALAHGGMMYAEPVILQLYGNAMAWGIAQNGKACK